MVVCLAPNMVVCLVPNMVDKLLYLEVLNSALHLLDKLLLKRRLYAELRKFTKFHSTTIQRTTIHGNCVNAMIHPALVVHQIVCIDLQFLKFL